MRASGSPPSSFSPADQRLMVYERGELSAFPLADGVLCGRSCRRVTDGVQTEEGERSVCMHVFHYNGRMHNSWLSCNLKLVVGFSHAPIASTEYRKNNEKKMSVHVKKSR